MSIRSTIDRLASTRWLVNTAKLGGWTALAQLVVVAATPAVTRLYTPRDLGSFGLFASFIGFVGVATALRYDMAIITAADEDEADTLLMLSLGLSVGVAIIGGSAIALLIRLDLLSYGALPSWTSAGAAVALAATGIFTSARCWHVRRAGFGTIGRALVGQAAGRAVVPVALGLAHTGWLGLMLGEIAGRTVGVGQLLRTAWPAARRTIRPYRPAVYRAALRRNKRYPAIVLPSSLVDALAMALPLPIVSSLFGSDAAGRFFLVMQVAGWPANLAGASAGDVFHEGLSATARLEPLRVPSVLWTSARHLAGIGLVVYVPLALLSPFVFGAVFGPQWAQAGILVALLAPYLLALLIVSPLSRLLLVVNRQEWKLIVDVVRLAVPVAAFFGGQRAGLGFVPCVALFGALNLLAFGVYMGAIVAAAREFGAASHHEDGAPEVRPS